MKKWLLILLCLLLLCGCTGKKDPENPDSPDKPSVEPGGEDIDHDALVYLNKLKEFKVRPKDASKTEDNKEFDAFLDQVFKDMLEEDYTSMHSSVIDYRALGLEKPEVTLGELEYKGDDIEPYVEILNELLSYDYDTLSYRQQYDYDVLEYSFYETLAQLGYNHYNVLYSGGNDIVGNIMTYMTDCVLHDKEEVDDFMILLDDLDRYLDDAITYTKAQIDDGIRMIDDSVDYTVDYVDRILSNDVDNNAIVTSFRKRLDGASFLNDAEKEEYLTKAKEIVEKQVIPALGRTRDFVEEQRGKVTDPTEMALCNLDKNYAELVYMLHGSNNISIDEAFQNAQDTFDTLVAGYLSGSYDETTMEQYDDIHENPGPALQGSAEDILNYLSENLDAYYPHLGAVAFDVDEMDASSADSSALAYYWPAPLDDLDQNVIRTNPNNLSNDIVESYSTLAHEGFPGHLYQHVYYQKTRPHKVRNTQNFVAYTEGYAVQAQIDAMHFGNIYEGATDMLADMVAFDYVYYFPLYSLIDIGINYYGWNTEEVKQFLSENYINPSAAESMISFLIDMPGTYCSYGLGLTNFMELRDYAKKELGDKFDIVAYNESVLKNGEMPFNILKASVDEYIAANK
ncbi:MAG: DUF885 family protein [Erysipelotrichaceae bacterium]|nr:DUF885 family protein [Erysipelotrichaceae bacterium]